MRKPNKNARRAKKQPTQRKLNEAITLLAKWATERQPLRFQDQSSALQHPGVVRKLSTGKDEFGFFADSGASVFIFPSIWTEVRAEIIPNVTEAIHVGEHDRHYTIAAWLTQKRDPAAIGAAIKAAEIDLDNWCALETQELQIIAMGPQCPTMIFYGGLAPRGDGYYYAKEKHSNLFFCFSPRNATDCSIQKLGERVLLAMRFGDYWIAVSETEMTASEIIRRFGPVSSVVH